MAAIRKLLRQSGWPACAIMTLLGASALVLVPRSDILTTIDISAPPAAVWSVLIDTDHYPAWNPMIAGLHGRLEKGAVIENIEGYGADRTIIWPTILIADTQRELRWRGHLWAMPGLFIGEHYFLLRPRAHGTLFFQGEHFSGVLLWVFDPQELLPAFEAMNIALAARVGRVPVPTPWQDRRVGPGPTRQGVQTGIDPLAHALSGVALCRASQSTTPCRAKFSSSPHSMPR